MGVESIVVCIDNSEWMRNGDFIPTRLHAQQDAVNVVARFKTKDNVETTIGLLTFSDSDVRVPLTTDYNKIAKSLQLVEPKGNLKFITGIRIAHLVLKHRLNRNHKTRIIAFVASPIADDKKEMERLAKRLKKEKIRVDVISFGEDDANVEKLTHFIDTLNGSGADQKESHTKCHLVQARPGPMLSDILINSPVMVGEDGVPIGMASGGSGFDFSMDPMAADDPELAMALRVSLEEQRQRQDSETLRVQRESLEQMQTSTGGASVGEGGGVLAQAGSSELPVNEGITGLGSIPDISEMTEEEQLAMALQMSMGGGIPEETEMETESSGPSESVIKSGTSEASKSGAPQSEDPEMQDLMQNKEFLQSVLSSLPGVNPEEALQNLQEMTEAIEEEEEEEEAEGKEKKEGDANKDKSS